MTDELKPCPFCGGEAELRTYETESLWSHNTVLYTQIGCGACDYHFATEAGMEVEAPERWNTRQQSILSESVNVEAGLVNCPDCGGRTAVASVCPHCGALPVDPAVFAALPKQPVNLDGEGVKAERDRCASVARYGEERASRDWRDPDKAEAARQMAQEIAEVIEYGPNWCPYNRCRAQVTNLGDLCAEHAAFTATGVNNG